MKVKLYTKAERYILNAAYIFILAELLKNNRITDVICAVQVVYIAFEDKHDISACGVENVLFVDLAKRNMYFMYYAGNALYTSPVRGPKPLYG